MRILIFGDSIAQGFWDTQGGWAQRLASYYQKQKIKNLEASVPEVFNLAVSGDTSQNVLTRFTHETIARKWPGEDFAFVFAVGINDSYIAGVEPIATPEQYAANVSTLIEEALTFAIKTNILFVGLNPVDEKRTTPVSWVDVTYLNKRIKLFDQTLEQTCVSYNVQYIPIFDLFKKHQQKTNLLLDGLHPNDEGHRLIFNQVKLSM